MLGAAEGFYRELFSSRGPLDSAGKYSDAFEGVLAEEERETIEGPLTLKKVSCTVSAIKRGTAPGCDGLPSEFYKAVFP